MIIVFFVLLFCKKLRYFGLGGDLVMVVGVEGVEFWWDLFVEEIFKWMDEFIE